MYGTPKMFLDFLSHSSVAGIRVGTAGEACWGTLSRLAKESCPRAGGKTQRFYDLVFAQIYLYWRGLPQSDHSALLNAATLCHVLWPVYL